MNCTDRAFDVCIFRPHDSKISHGVKVGHDSKSRPALHEAEATHSPACDDDVAHNNRNQQAEMLCCVLLRQVVRGNMNVYIYIALARSGA